MKRTLWKLLLLIGTLVVWTGCAEEGPTETPGPTYAQLVNNGWLEYFTNNNYLEAVGFLEDAKALDPDAAAAYTALGWIHMKKDSLSKANVEFTDGSGKADATADLYAGWAFLLNALKSYSSSNSQANQALTLDAAWSFVFITNLNSDDLRILKAMNYYALGNFAQSLVEVQSINPSFNSLDPALLAAEIERLKGVESLEKILSW